MRLEDELGADGEAREEQGRGLQLLPGLQLLGAHCAHSELTQSSMRGVFLIPDQGGCTLNVPGPKGLTRRLTRWFIHS